MALFFRGVQRNYRFAASRLGEWSRGLCHVLAVLLACLVLSGCSAFLSTPPAVTVVSVQDLGTIPTNPDILGRDGGYSALFQGQSVWVYGDTFLAQPNTQGFTLISDSWSYTSDLSARGGITGFQEPLDSAGAPVMLLPETPAEQAFNAAHNGSNCQQPCGARWALWPASVVVNSESNQALVFYSLVSAQPGDFNFQSVGYSVASWQGLTYRPQRPTINPPVVPAHPDLLFNQNEPAFGSASLISNGVLYVYGCGVATNGFDKGCRLGKVVAPENVLNRSAWSYYAGNGSWSAQIGDAISAFSAASILSVAWNNYLQLYLAVYSEPFSQDVMLRTAPAPEGPWSQPVKAFTAMQPSQGNVYDAHAHPEYDANGGQTIYVSYSRSTPAPFTSEVRLVSVQLGRVPNQKQ
jgi:hypothetical protein